MRKLLIAIGIVLVVIMATPFVVGIIAEGTVRARLDAMNESQFIALRVDDYDRGWLSSRTRLEFGFGESYLDQIETVAQQPQVTDVLRNFGIPVIVEFTHGPLLVGEISGIGFLGVKAYADPESQFIELAETFLGVPYLFEFRGKSEFGDGFHFTGDIPEFGGALGDISYDFSGIDLVGVSTLDHLEFEAVLEEASLQGPLLSAVLESLRMTTDSELRPGSFSLGTSAVTLDRLAVINPSLGASPMLSAENLNIATTVSENAEATHLDVEVAYSIGRMAVADSFELSDAALGLHARHLDIAAMNEISAAANWEEMANDPAAIMSTVMPLLDRIIAGSPEIAIDPLQFTLAEGSFNGRVNLGLDGSALPTGSINDFLNPAVAMQAITADADFTAAKPLVEMIARLVTAEDMPAMSGPDGGPLPPEQFAAMLDARVAQTLGALTTFGLLRVSGDDYTCAITLRDGALTANGLPVPLPF
jgi:uncharacterized protein YdgA (DUF945 family)